MSKRLLALLSLLVVASMVLAACGSQPTATATAPATATATATDIPTNTPTITSTPTKSAVEQAVEDHCNSIYTSKGVSLYTIGIEINGKAYSCSSITEVPEQEFMPEQAETVLEVLASACSTVTNTSGINARPTVLAISSAMVFACDEITEGNEKANALKPAKTLKPGCEYLYVGPYEAGFFSTAQDDIAHMIYFTNATQLRYVERGVISFDGMLMDIPAEPFGEPSNCQPLEAETQAPADNTPTATPRGDNCPLVDNNEYELRFKFDAAQNVVNVTATVCNLYIPNGQRIYGVYYGEVNGRDTWTYAFTVGTDGVMPGLLTDKAFVIDSDKCWHIGQQNGYQYYMCPRPATATPTASNTPTNTPTPSATATYANTATPRP